MESKIYYSPAHKMENQEPRKPEASVSEPTTAAEPIYFDQTKKREYLYSELIDFIEEIDEIYDIYSEEE